MITIVASDEDLPPVDLPGLVAAGVRHLADARRTGSARSTPKRPLVCDHCKLGRRLMPLPDGYWDDREESKVVNGLFYPATVCKVCHKRYPPYKVAYRPGDYCNGLHDERL